MAKPKGSPKTGGRQAGTPNKRTVDGEAYARAILEDEQVRARILRQAQAGKLPVQVLVHFLQLAFGTPKELTVYTMQQVAHDAHAANGQDPTRFILTPFTPS